VYFCRTNGINSLAQKFRQLKKLGEAACLVSDDSIASLIMDWLFMLHKVPITFVISFHASGVTGFYNVVH